MGWILFGAAPLIYPEWLSPITFPWRIFFDTIVTFAVAAFFSSKA
jgi:hypothetical protein